jgi:hypothetical protein
MIEELDEPTVTEEASTNGAGPEPGSVRDLVRQRRDAALGQKTTTLEVPGYAGLLKVRYAALPDDDFRRLIKKATDATEKGGAINAMGHNADLLIRACQGILVPASADDDAPLEQLVDDDDVPVKFDDRFAAWLGVEIKTARQVVYATFATAPQKELAIGAQVEDLLSWMRGAQAATDEEVADF